MRIELEVAGHDVHFVSINKADGVPTQEEMLKFASFPQLQDTEELGIWDRMGGGKDDFYILDAEGKLQTYLQFYGAVGTTLSEPEDYQNVKNAILSVLDGKTSEPEPDAEPDTPEPAADIAEDAGPEADAPTPDATTDEDASDPDAAADAPG
jgi:hypothetical protein